MIDAPKWEGFPNHDTHGVPLTLCLEFGSSAGRCACGARDGRGRRPTQLEVSTSFHDGDGRWMKSCLLHTDLHFDLEQQSWQFSRPSAALYGKMHTTGLKPALDGRMCQAATPGAQCRELCKKIQAKPFDLLKHFLLKLLRAIYDHLKSLDHKFCVERLVVPLPGMWFHDPESSKLHNEIAGSIQAQIRRILIREGIREQQIAFVAEGFLSCRSALGIVPATTKTVYLIDFGHTTMDTAFGSILNGDLYLPHPPEAFSAGMALVWQKLHELCEVKGKAEWFPATRTMVFAWDGEAELLNANQGVPISRDEMKLIFHDVYETHLEKVKRFIHLHKEIDLVLLNGASITANEGMNYIIRNILKDGRYAVKAQIQVAPAEDASFAVCQGGAIPWPDDPLRELKANRLCWEIKSRLGRPSEEAKAASTNYLLLEFKGANSLKFGDWESMQPDADTRILRLTPHVLRPEVKSNDKSQDTGNPIYLGDEGMPMDSFDVDLSKDIVKGEEVWVKMSYHESDGLVIMVLIGKRTPIEVVEVKRLSLQVQYDVTRLILADLEDNTASDEALQFSVAAQQTTVDSSTLDGSPELINAAETLEAAFALADSRQASPDETTDVAVQIAQVEAASDAETSSRKRRRVESSLLAREESTNSNSILAIRNLVE